MEGNHCRLFDENLVRNIMISTGLSIYEYIKGHSSATVPDICDYLELNADTIIWNTIEDMNNASDYPSQDGDDEPAGDEAGRGDEALF
jgi:hypothetical protein